MKRKNKNKMKPIVLEKFMYSVTYSETTPESVRDGDFSETGFLSEDNPA